jgi:hypothetical protein
VQLLGRSCWSALGAQLLDAELLHALPPRGFDIEKKQSKRLNLESNSVDIEIGGKFSSD